MRKNLKIALVVFDWAGTTVDFGSMAPVEAMLAAFAKHRLMLTLPQVRAPMGLHKYDHVRALLEMPAVAEQYQFVHARPWTEADCMEIYHDLEPLQADSAARRCELNPGVLELAGELRRRQIKIGTTTGYPRAIAEPVYDAASSSGFTPDCNVAADDTPAARPAPWMLFRVMEQLDVFPPAAVVKVGDTVPDIEEGLSAGCWSLGITSSGSEVGLSLAEWNALPESQRRDLHERANRRLLDAGAHYVLPTLADLPSVLDHIDARLETGERP